MSNNNNIKNCSHNQHGLPSISFHFECQSFQCHMYYHVWCEGFKLRKEEIFRWGIEQLGILLSTILFWLLMKVARGHAHRNQEKSLTKSTD